MSHFAALEILINATTWSDSASEEFKMSYIQCCMTIYHFWLLEWVQVTKYQSTLAAFTVCRNIQNFQKKIFFQRTKICEGKKEEGNFWNIERYFILQNGILEMICLFNRHVLKLHLCYPNQT
jgi:hypothetical protein